jgi:hypothetical protein
VPWRWRYEAIIIGLGGAVWLRPAVDALDFARRARVFLPAQSLARTATLDCELPTIDSSVISRLKPSHAADSCTGRRAFPSHTSEAFSVVRSFVRVVKQNSTSSLQVVMGLNYAAFLGVERTGRSWAMATTLMRFDAG